MNTVKATVQATLDADGVTLRLEEKLPLPPGRVQVTVQRSVEPSRPGLLEVLDQIHRDQRARGRSAMTEEEMQAEIAALRAEEEQEEERWRGIWSQAGDGPETGETP